MAQSICHEAGKPITSARVEVRRAIEVFRLAAAELTASGGSSRPGGPGPGGRGRGGGGPPLPAGVVVGIVPFNFPLNLGAHKVAPALAVGAPIIVKPPPQAPGAQLLLAEIAQQAGADPRPSRSSPATTPSPSGWPPIRGSASSPSPGARGGLVA
jgi:acyl-CoA reductase-like NAD-dependent aldehyde dehydrogenase